MKRMQILLLLFLFLILGCTDIRYITDSNYAFCKKQPNQIVRAGHDASINPQIECFSELAQKYSDISLCNEIDGSSYKGSCGGMLAVSKNNLQLCNLLNKENNKVGCIAYYAAKKFDYQICNNLDNKDDRLYCLSTAVRSDRGDYSRIPDSVCEAFPEEKQSSNPWILNKSECYDRHKPIYWSSPLP